MRRLAIIVMWASGIGFGVPAFAADMTSSFNAARNEISSLGSRGTEQMIAPVHGIYDFNVQFALAAAGRDAAARTGATIGKYLSADTRAIMKSLSDLQTNEQWKAVMMSPTASQQILIVRDNAKYQGLPIGKLSDSEFLKNWALGAATANSFGLDGTKEFCIYIIIPCPITPQPVPLNLPK